MSGELNKSSAAFVPKSSAAFVPKSMKSSAQAFVPKSMKTSAQAFVPKSASAQTPPNPFATSQLSRALPTGGTEYVPTSNARNMPGQRDPSGGGGGAYSGHHMQDMKHPQQTQASYALQEGASVAYGAYEEAPAPREEQQQARVNPLSRPVSSFFMAEPLRQQIHKWNELTVLRLQPENPLFHQLPLTIDHDRYHSLCPLGSDRDISRHKSERTTSTECIKVTSAKDGLPYVIRRVKGVSAQAEDLKYAKKAAASWKAVQRASNNNHPNLVHLRRIFVSKDFSDGQCMCFAYDFWPGSQTLADRYRFKPRFSLPSKAVVSEGEIWSIMCQLASALVTIHSQELAALNINAGRILVRNNRVKINGTGILEAVRMVPQAQSLAELQYRDLLDLGHLLVSIMCQSHESSSNLDQALGWVFRNYSQDLGAVLQFLLSAQTQKLPTVFDLTAQLGHRFVAELQLAYAHIDYLEHEVSKEVQNGRLFRLLMKMGFINERPEHKKNPKWSETGDRYLIKLLRDLIFHSVDDDERPQVDFGHAVSCLNKLDVGVDEKTMLMSRNQESMLLVSYKDLHRCIQEAFNDLLTESERPVSGAKGTEGNAGEEYGYYPAQAVPMGPGAQQAQQYGMQQQYAQQYAQQQYAQMHGAAGNAGGYTEGQQGGYQ